MAQTKKEIQAILAEAGVLPRQQWGQNFMIDANLVGIVADAAEIKPGEMVIEIGPGTGTLTQELLSRGARVTAVEIDRRLAESLARRLSGLRIIEGDALAGKHELNTELAALIAEERGRGGIVKLAANLPYNIASPLVIELLRAGVEQLVFTVQREVAARLRAGPGTSEYGALSITAQMLARVEVLRVLPPQAFWPRPKVESALVRMRRDDRLGEHSAEFGRFVQQMFGARRKTLRNALQQAEYDADKALAASGVDGKRRAEELSVAEMWGLFGAR